MSTQATQSRRAAVVGGGLGAIGAAVSLAAEGWQVDLFEKNSHLGGKLNQLRDQGFSFDLGPSILTMPQVFERLWQRAGKTFNEYVDTLQVYPHWRNFFEDGVTIDLYPSADETIKKNESLSDSDGRDLERFLDHSGRLYARYERAYFDQGLDTTWEMIRHHASGFSLLDLDLLRSMDGSMSRFVREPHLRDVLNFFAKYVGSSPYDAPGVLNMLPYVQAEFGLWYVKGGLYNLAIGLQRLVEDVGVRAHVEVEVAQITRDGDRVTGVQLADGSTFDADVVVCNMEVIPAYKRLLGQSDASLKKLAKFHPSCSGMVLHLGLDCEYPQLAHHNFFFSQNPRKHFASVFHDNQLPGDPTIYLVAACSTDPTQAPEGCSGLKILPHIPHLQDEPFTAEQYDAFKQRVIDKLERMGLTDLRRHVIYEHTWFPEDIERLYYSNRGAIYGVVSDRRRNGGFKAPKQSNRFKDLYFVGGSVNPGAGMPMALLSGQQVADRILRKGVTTGGPA